MRKKVGPMPNDLAIPSPAGALATGGSGFTLPAVIADQGDRAAERFFTFFTDTLPNPNTRAAYYRNALRFFAWTHAKGLTLPTIKSYHVSAYLAELAAGHATPTVKQHLASLRMLFDWLITGQVIEINPAAAVRAAKHVVKKGKTPVLQADEARDLLDSIPLKTGKPPKDGEPDNRPPCLIGLRDRALIAVMVYSFARITAALGMKVEDYYTEGRRAWFRLQRAASGTRCPPTTTPRITWMRTSLRQASPMTRKAPSSAPPGARPASSPPAPCPAPTP
jgi:site-specific recombinase XerD